MNLHRTAFTVHRILSYFVVLQVFAWIVGGVVFALLPFDSVVKGGAVVTKPVARLSGDWRQALHSAPVRPEDVAAIETFASPYGAAIRMRTSGGPVFVRADGAAWRAPDSAVVARWARELYHGSGTLAGVTRLERDRRRAGIVLEAGPRHDLWRASFTDRLHTRFYFDGASGEYLMVRNDAWVLYDFFFRLHVMDYAGGEDFNNLPLRVFAVTALAFALSGAVLTFAAARRAVGRIRPRAGGREVMP